MGYDGYGVENALDGLASQLTSDLNEGRVPRWLNGPDNLEREREHASQNRGALVEFRFDKDRAPEPVKSACQNFLETRKDSIEYSDGADFVQFRRFVVNFRVNEDGELHSPFVTAVFKNH